MPASAIGREDRLSLREQNLYDGHHNHGTDSMPSASAPAARAERDSSWRPAKRREHQRQAGAERLHGCCCSAYIEWDMTSDDFV